jgi:hypothetical protein
MPSLFPSVTFRMNFLARLLLLYQLENYESLRFLRLVYGRPKLLFARGARKPIVWTHKLRALVGVTVLLVGTTGFIWQ